MLEEVLPQSRISLDPYLSDWNRLEFPALRSKWGPLVAREAKGVPQVDKVLVRFGLFKFSSLFAVLVGERLMENPSTPLAA